MTSGGIATVRLISWPSVCATVLFSSLVFKTGLCQKQPNDIASLQPFLSVSTKVGVARSKFGVVVKIIIVFKYS